MEWALWAPLKVEGLPDIQSLFLLVPLICLGGLPPRGHSLVGKLMPGAVSHSNFPLLELRDCLQPHADWVQPEGQPKARQTGSDHGISAPKWGPLGGPGGRSWGGGEWTRWFLRCGPSLYGGLPGFHLIVHGQPPGPLSVSEPLGTFLFELKKGRNGFFVCK